jgi:hypothetical protein
MKLSAKQTYALEVLENRRTQELLYGGGAGGGKSILGCYWVCKSALKYRGTRWVIGRARLKTLRETTLVSLFKVMAMQGLKQNIHYRYYESKSTIVFHNSSVILLKDLAHSPSDPNYDELGSLEITGAFVDECSQITQQAWNVLQSRIRHGLDDHGLVPKMLGTCNPTRNWVYMHFYQPFRKNALPVHRHFVQSLVGDNPHISTYYKQSLLKLDKVSRERLLLGNWDYDDDPAALCHFDAIMDVFTNSHVERTGEKYISADLAMRGRDRFVAGLWDGLVCEVKIDREQSSGKEIETMLRQMMHDAAVPASHMVADSDGLGNYLESYLRGIKEFRGGARAYNDKEFANIKSECGYKLAELVNSGRLYILCSEEQQPRIIEELATLKADNIDADESKKRIIKKETMKEALGRSPDYLDMLLMRMVYELRPKRNGSFAIDRFIHL